MDDTQTAALQLHPADTEAMLSRVEGIRRFAARHADGGRRPVARQSRPFPAMASPPALAGTARMLEGPRRTQDFLTGLPTLTGPLLGWPWDFPDREFLVLPGLSGPTEEAAPGFEEWAPLSSSSPPVLRRSTATAGAARRSGTAGRAFHGPTPAGTASAGMPGHPDPASPRFPTLASAGLAGPDPFLLLTRVLMGQAPSSAAVVSGVGGQPVSSPTAPGAVGVRGASLGSTPAPRGGSPGEAREVPEAAREVVLHSVREVLTEQPDAGTGLLESPAGTRLAARLLDRDHSQPGVEQHFIQGAQRTLARGRGRSRPLVRHLGELAAMLGPRSPALLTLLELPETTAAARGTDLVQGLERTVGRHPGQAQRLGQRLALTHPEAAPLLARYLLARGAQDSPLWSVAVAGITASPTFALRFLGGLSAGGTAQRGAARRLVANSPERARTLAFATGRALAQQSGPSGELTELLGSFVGDRRDMAAVAMRGLRGGAGAPVSSTGLLWQVPFRLLARGAETSPAFGMLLDEQLRALARQPRLLATWAEEHPEAVPLALRRVPTLGLALLGAGPTPGTHSGLATGTRSRLARTASRGLLGWPLTDPRRGARSPGPNGEWHRRRSARTPGLPGFPPSSPRSGAPLSRTIGRALPHPIGGPERGYDTGLFPAAGLADLAASGAAANPATDRNGSLRVPPQAFGFLLRKLSQPAGGGGPRRSGATGPRGGAGLSSFLDSSLDEPLEGASRAASRSSGLVSLIQSRLRVGPGSPQLLRRATAGGPHPRSGARDRTHRASAGTSPRRERIGRGILPPPASLLYHLDTAERGRPLPTELRQWMEHSFGADFGGVRVHRGAAAQQMSEHLQADAFTIGSHIAFGAGQYKPHSPAGQALLAHELMHVVQQTGRGLRLHGYGAAPQELEAEARHVERIFRSGAASKGEGFRVGHYERHYHNMSPGPLHQEHETRLERISLRALELCREQLERDPRLRLEKHHLERLHVEVDLDLEQMTDEDAADTMARAMAQAVRRKLPARGVAPRRTAVQTAAAGSGGDNRSGRTPQPDPALLAQGQDDQTRDLQQQLRRLAGRIRAGREGHLDIKKLREEQWIVGAVSDLMANPFKWGGNDLPDLAMWDLPLESAAQARRNLDAGHLDEARKLLARATQECDACFQRLTEYREGMATGAGRAVTVLEGTAAAGAIAATVATGGAAAAAGGGMLAVAGAGAAGAGLYGATSEGASQTGEKLAGTRKEFDFGAIFKRGLTDAVVGFVGALAGGALSGVLKRCFGAYLKTIGDDVLLELGKKAGLGGPLPRDYFLTKSQQFIADFFGGLGTAPLTTAVTLVLERVTGGGPLPDKKQFVQMVVNEMVQGGIIQLFLGAFLAKYGARGAIRPRRGQKSADPSHSRPAPEAGPTPESATASRSQADSALPERPSDTPTSDPQARQPQEKAQSQRNAPQTPAAAKITDEFLVSKGNWDAAIKEFGADSPEARAMEARRTEIMNEIDAKFGGKRTGTSSPASDVDLSFEGANAERRLRQARKFMEDRFGPNWEKTFKSSFNSDPYRSHAYTDPRLRLTDAQNAKIQTDLTLASQREVLARMKQAGQHSEAVMKEFLSDCQRLGIDPATISAEPLRPTQVRQLEVAQDKAINTLEGKLRQLEDARNRPGSMSAEQMTELQSECAQLSYEVSHRQLRINSAYPDRYMTPGGLKATVSGELMTPDRVGGLSLQEAYQKVLNERLEMLDRVAHAEAELRQAGQYGDPVDALAKAAEKYEFSKYAYRTLDIADRLGLSGFDDLRAQTAELYKPAQGPEYRGEAGEKFRSASVGAYEGAGPEVRLRVFAQLLNRTQVKIMTELRAQGALPAQTSGGQIPAVVKQVAPPPAPPSSSSRNPARKGPSGT